MKKRGYILKPRVKIFLILLFVCYFGIIMFKQELKMDEQRERIHALKEQIAHTEDTNADLEHMIHYTDSDEYIEKVARERLGWVKKGEIIFIEKKKEN